jgi:hypothetical protein
MSLCIYLYNKGSEWQRTNDNNFALLEIWALHPIQRIMIELKNFSMAMDQVNMKLYHFKRIFANELLLKYLFDTIRVLVYHRNGNVNKRIA